MSPYKVLFGRDSNYNIHPSGVHDAMTDSRVSVAQGIESDVCDLSSDTQSASEVFFVCCLVSGHAWLLVYFEYRILPLSRKMHYSYLSTEQVLSHLSVRKLQASVRRWTNKW